MVWKQTISIAILLIAVAMVGAGVAWAGFCACSDYCESCQISRQYFASNIGCGIDWICADRCRADRCSNKDGSSPTCQ